MVSALLSTFLQGATIFLDSCDVPTPPVLTEIVLAFRLFIGRFTVKTGDVGTSPGRFTGETCQATLLSAACGDCRLIGGWSSWEAGVFHAGTSPGDGRRKVSSGGPARAKVSMRQVRGGVTRNNVESRANPEGAKGWPPLSSDSRRKRKTPFERIRMAAGFWLMIRRLI